MAGLPFASNSPVITSCCPSRAVDSPTAARLRIPPVALSISISIDSLRICRPRADKPPVAAGGWPRFASLGTQAKPNGGRSTTAQTPSSVNWATRNGPSGTKIHRRVRQDHRSSPRNAGRIEHQVPRAMLLRVLPSRSCRCSPRMPSGKRLRPLGLEQCQRGRCLIMPTRLDQAFDLLERRRHQRSRLNALPSPADERAIAQRQCLD